MVVWTVDGLLDGASDGIEVGSSDACSLGLFEGIEVAGDELGAFDGLEVGSGDDGVGLGRRDGAFVVGILLGLELGWTVKRSVGDTVGLKDARLDDVAVDGALVEGSPVTCVAVVLLLDPLFLAS